MVRVRDSNQWRVCSAYGASVKRRHSVAGAPDADRARRPMNGGDCSLARDAIKRPEQGM